MAVNISRTYDRLAEPPGRVSRGGVRVIGGKLSGTLELAASTVQSETVRSDLAYRF
jgi:hypothetical protein